MAIVYKIRRSDGLFSMGGCDPRFNKVGKIWKQRGHLTNHLTWVAEHGRRGTKTYDDCEVVQYELTETQVGEPISINGYIQEHIHKKFLAEQERDLRNKVFQREQRRKQYEALKSEFGE